MVGLNFLTNCNDVAIFLDSMVGNFFLVRLAGAILGLYLCLGLHLDELKLIVSN